MDRMSFSPTLECPFFALPCGERKKTAHPDQLRQFKQGQPSEFSPGRHYKIKYSLTSFSFPFSLFPQGRHDAAGWNTNSSLCTLKHSASSCSGRKIKKDSVYSGRNYFHALAALAGRQQYSPPLLWHTQPRSTNLCFFSFVINCK